jgi:hypothetical protein
MFRFVGFGNCIECNNPIQNVTVYQRFMSFDNRFIISLFSYTNQF